jgi:hypothetical protein
MDSWTPRQVKSMQQGGNARCNAFLQRHGIELETSPSDIHKLIRHKYDSPAAELYKLVLKAELDGTPVPTELPKRDETGKSQFASPVRMRKMEGFGSSPPAMPAQADNDGHNNKAKAILLVAIPAVAAAAFYLLVPH